MIAIKMIRMEDWLRLKEAIQELVEGEDNLGYSGDLTIVYKSDIENLRKLKDLIKHAPDGEAEESLFSHYQPLESESKYNPKIELNTAKKPNRRPISLDRRDLKRKHLK